MRNVLPFCLGPFIIYSVFKRGKVRDIISCFNPRFLLQGAQPYGALYVDRVPFPNGGADPGADTAAEEEDEEEDEEEEDEEGDSAVHPGQNQSSSSGGSSSRPTHR